MTFIPSKDYNGAGIHSVECPGHGVKYATGYHRGLIKDYQVIFIHCIVDLIRMGSIDWDIECTVDGVTGNVLHENPVVSLRQEGHRSCNKDGALSAYSIINGSDQNL